MIIFAWLISTALWLCVWIPFYILGFLVTWAGLMGQGREVEHMWFPWWFWDSNAGINGTLRYENLNWVYICNPQVNWNVPDPLKLAMSIVDAKTGNERTFGKRWEWVTWRNPVTNVSRWLIGCGQKQFNRRVWTFGKLKIERLSSFPWWSYSFSFYWTDKHYSFYRFGWKLDDVQQGRSCFMYRITPWRSV